MKASRAFVLAGAVAAVVIAFCCCSGHRHFLVTPEEFLELAERPVGSAVDARFIGATGSRAYLSLWSALPSAVGGGEDVYSVDLDELPADLAARIRSGENPWPE